MTSTEYTPLTERDKVLFDLKGFLLFPAVLSETEMAPLRVQCLALRQDKEWRCSSPTITSTCHHKPGFTEQMLGTN